MTATQTVTKEPPTGSFAPGKCDNCGKRLRNGDVFELVGQVSRQTHWEPAEYEQITVDGKCYEDLTTEIEPDPDRYRDDF